LYIVRIFPFFKQTVIKTISDKPISSFLTISRYNVTKTSFQEEVIEHSLIKQIKLGQEKLEAAYPCRAQMVVEKDCRQLLLLATWRTGQLCHFLHDGQFCQQATWPNQ
jgi:hypothetical protein